MINKIILELVRLILTALLTHSTDGDKVSAIKKNVGAVLGKLGANPQGDLAKGVEDVINHVVAANPPARDDVQSAATIGEIVVPPPTQSKEVAPPETKQSDGDGKHEGGEGGANAPPP